MAYKEWLSREEKLIGEEKIRKLERSSVLVFGAGGVGSYVIEALARSGVGRITVIDGDRVSLSNINRQLIADRETVGREKATVAAERILRINPECRAVGIAVFADENNIPALVEKAAPDFIVDAIDCVSAKIFLACHAAEKKIPMIASMGTGNKLDPSKFQIADIAKTSVCPLARVMRRELRERGIGHLPVLFSTEEPVKTGDRTPASISYVPSAAGLMIGGYVIRKLMEEENVGWTV